MRKQSQELSRRTNFAHLLVPTYTGPQIRRYFGGAWSMHLPFAWDVVRELKPRVFVELGVYKGESYFAFCQSVKENDLFTLCYGVDTWRGDIHMGTYGPEIGREVEAYNARYSAFSQLLRMSFDEASSNFADASIDLLHIDGAHRYEDVRHDFENWLPKVSEEGIILFHDVMVRDGDFGVWRLWQEVARSKASFVFEFGHGLGVWKKKQVSEKDPRFILKLLLADEDEHQEIVNHYAIAAAAISLREKKPIVTSLQIFVQHDRTFDEHCLAGCDFVAEKWQRLTVSMPSRAGAGGGPLRFDPGSEPGIIEIARILIRSRNTNEILWRAKGPVELSCLVVGGTAVAVSHERVFRILNFGVDPQVLLPALGEAAVEVPLTFEVWMRLDTSAQKMGECFADAQSRHLADERQLQNDVESKAAALLAAVEERRAAEQQRELVETRWRAAEQQRELVETGLREAQNQNESKQVELAALRSELERLERELWETKVRRADLTARVQERDEWMREVKESVAWKLAKPFWKLQRHFSRPVKNGAAAPKFGELVFTVDDAGTWSASGDVLNIKGWCFARGGPQVAGVRAKIGRKSYFARYGLRREDVAGAALDYPAALYSGFSIKVPIPRAASSVRLEAIVQGRSWKCFLEHPLNSATTERGNTPAHENVRGPAIHGPDGNYEHRPPVLYPGISANEVLPVLAPSIQQHLKRMGAKAPFFSVITPTFNTLPRWIAEAGASLLNQTLTSWEWCVVDDGSQNPETRQGLELLASAHPGLRVKFMERAGISAATNEALDLATGEFVCFLDHDDLFAPEALERITEKLSEGFDVVYSDEDKLEAKSGTLVEPFFKPEWSPEYFRGAMYVGHLLCLRRELACRVRFDGEFDGIQDFDFMLRVSETGARIAHVPKILYHWRKVAGSLAEASDAKPHAAALQQKAVNAQLKRLGLAARAEPGATPHRLKMVPAQRVSFPKVSIVIPTKDASDLLSRCLTSLYEKTAYPNFEVVLIDNDTTNREALEVMRAHPVVRLYLSNPFNFSRANNLAAQHAAGEYLVFLNNDTEIISPQWLDHLLYYAEQRDVGAVGALLLHENGAVQHGGVVLGMRGTADHAMRGFPGKSDGYAGSLSSAREVSAVTAACMMMRKSMFEQLGGFNEHFFTIYQDVDLCLRLRERGLRIIWTPQALLLHHESISRRKYYDMVDRYLLLDQWQNTIERGDPYYSPNLNLELGDYSSRS